MVTLKIGMMRLNVKTLVFNTYVLSMDSSVRIRVMVFNATFNNISDISW